MEKFNFNITKVVVENETVYRVADCDVADYNRAIYGALLMAARDLWQHLLVTPGTYTSQQLLAFKHLFVDASKIPSDLHRIRVECGAFACSVRCSDLDIYTFFSCLNQYEKLAGAKNRASFIKGKSFGDLLSSVTFTVPKDIKAITRHCDDAQSERPLLRHPYIDVELGALVATSGKTLVARKVQIKEHRVSDMSPMRTVPRDIEKLAGQDVTVSFYVGGVSIENAAGLRYDLETDGFGRCPNWRSVVPTSTTERLPIDTVALRKALKMLLPSKSCDDYRVTFKAERGKHVMHIAYDDIDFSESKALVIPIAWESKGFGIDLRRGLTENVLALKPTSLRYVDSSRAIVWENADTLILQMPIIPEDTVEWNGKLTSFPLDTIFTQITSPTPPSLPKPRTKRKAHTPKASTIKHESATPTPAVSQIDSLRAALRAAMRRQGLVIAA